MRRLLQPIWNLFRPLRAGLVARLDRIVYDASARAVAAHDPRPSLVEFLKDHFAVLRAHMETSEKQSDEISLVLDALVAEQFRLQSEVADLRRRLDEVLASEPAPAQGWR